MSGEFSLDFLQSWVQRNSFSSWIWLLFFLLFLCFGLFCLFYCFFLNFIQFFFLFILFFLPSICFLNKFEAFSGCKVVTGSRCWSFSFGFCVEGSNFGSLIKSLTLILLLSLFSLFSVGKKHNKRQSTFRLCLYFYNNSV